MVWLTRLGSVFDEDRGDLDSDEVINEARNGFHLRVASVFDTLNQLRKVEMVHATGLTFIKLSIKAIKFLHESTLEV